MSTVSPIPTPVPTPAPGAAPAAASAPDRWIAIAAMATNRVIGRDNTIPWHLPEDFRWFKETTMGGTLVMGRRTYESIGRPLPGRRTVVLTRSGFQVNHPLVVCLPHPAEVNRLPPQPPIFLCGGARLYQDLLPACSELLLTRVRQTVEGDAFFPPFEHLFEPAGTIRETPGFTIERWILRGAPTSLGNPGTSVPA